MADRVFALHKGNRCCVQIRIREKDTEEYGMYGSGMIILNPPWILKQALEESLPFLAQAAGKGSSSWTLQWDNLE
jgi:23S rRNA (adenine2030-N6)-methyltransferase